jgi:microcin C transport system permease protein
LSPSRQNRFRPATLPLALLVLLGLAGLCAPVLANSTPLLVSFHGKLYIPLLTPLPETFFGPQFLPTTADYQNPRVQAAIRAQGWLIFPPIPYRYDTIVFTAPPAPAPPSAQDWLGTDEVSRDVLARLLWSLRFSLLFGLALTAGSCALGLAAGILQGYYGGAADLLFQRFIEIWSGMPRLFLLLILTSLLAHSLTFLLIFLVAFSWMSLAATIRAEAYRARTLDHVRAARLIGLPDIAILRRHILPHAAIAAVTFAPFILADSITLLASLDFLNLGLPGSASLGELAAEARDNLYAPWLAASAFGMISALLILLVLTGESFRQTARRA